MSWSSTKFHITNVALTLIGYDLSIHVSLLKGALGSSVLKGPVVAPSVWVLGKRGLHDSNLAVAYVHFTGIHLAKRASFAVYELVGLLCFLSALVPT